MTELFTAGLDTPLGQLTVTATADGIVAVKYGATDSLSPVAPQCLRQAVTELGEYFAGERTVFSVPVLRAGTQFQTAVWAALDKIPFGGTVSYQTIAAGIGRVRAVRAVGAANGRNRINIIVPCHRVVGADGSLTGYSGGLERKEWLLAHEARVLARRQR